MKFLFTQVAKSTDATETELLLATLSVAIARYCSQAGIPTPPEIPITVRR